MTNLHEQREGQVIFVCPGPDAYQRDPGLGESAYAPWFAVQNQVYKYVPYTFGDFQAYSPQDGEFTYALGLGPPGEGYNSISNELVQPMVQKNYVSQWVDPWQKQLPDIAYFDQDGSDIELIPADAYVKYVYWQFYYRVAPDLPWQYFLKETRHTNTHLPQPTGLDNTNLTWYDQSTFNPIDYPEGYWPDEYLQITPTAGTINARDACLQDFELTAIFGCVGAGQPSETPVIQLPYAMSMIVVWRGAIDAESVDEWHYAPFDGFGMTMAGDIQRQRNLSGAMALAMNGGTSDIKLIGNMAGTLDAGMSNIVDATNDEGGIDNGIDNTGWFNASLDLDDNNMLGNFRIDATCSMSLDMDDSALEKVGSMVGSFTGVSAFLGDLQKEGTLWVEDDSFVMSMDFASAPIGGTMSCIGALPFSMVLAADLLGQRQLAGALSASLGLTSYVERDLELAGAMSLGMVGSGTIVRNVNISGAYNASLAFYANITYDYSEPALDENTYSMGAIDRTIYHDADDRSIFINVPSERN